jgi:hypothetical protein
MSERKKVIEGTVKRAGKVLDGITSAVESHGHELDDQQFAAIFQFLSNKLQEVATASTLARQMAKARNTTFSFDDLPKIAPAVAPTIAPITIHVPQAIAMPPVVTTAMGPVTTSVLPPSMRAERPTAVEDEIAELLEDEAAETRVPHPEDEREHPEDVPEPGTTRFNALSNKQRRDLGFVPMGKVSKHASEEEQARWPSGVMWGRPEKPKIEPPEPGEIPHPKHGEIKEAGFIEE